MLRASRRVLRPGGRTAFHSITVAPGLSRRDRRRAARWGPPAVATSSTYPRLLRSAGFVDVEETDRTADYLATAQAWMRHEQEEAERPGAPAYLADGSARRRDTAAAIEDGVLRRAEFVATRPPGSRR